MGTHHSHTSDTIVVLILGSIHWRLKLYDGFWRSNFITNSTEITLGCFHNHQSCRNLTWWKFVEIFFITFASTFFFHPSYIIAQATQLAIYNSSYDDTVNIGYTIRYMSKNASWIGPSTLFFLLLKDFHSHHHSHYLQLLNSNDHIGSANKSQTLFPISKYLVFSLLGKCFAILFVSIFFYLTLQHWADCYDFVFINYIG